MIKFILPLLFVSCLSLEKMIEPEEATICRNILDGYSTKTFDKNQLQQQYKDYLANIYPHCTYSKFQNHPTFTNYVNPTLMGLTEIVNQKIQKIKQEITDQEQVIGNDLQAIEKEGKAVNITEKEKKLSEIDSKLETIRISQKVELDTIESAIELKNSTFEPNCNVYGDTILHIEEKIVGFIGTAICNEKAIAYNQRIGLIGYTQDQVRYGKVVLAEGVHYIEQIFSDGIKYYSFSGSKNTPQLKKAQGKAKSEIEKLEKEKLSLDGSKEKASLEKEKQAVEKQIAPYRQLQENLKMNTEKVESLKRSLEVEIRVAEDYNYHSPRFYK